MCIDALRRCFSSGSIFPVPRERSPVEELVYKVGLVVLCILKAIKWLVFDLPQERFSVRDPDLDSPPRSSPGTPPLATSTPLHSPRSSSPFLPLDSVRLQLFPKD